MMKMMRMIMMIITHNTNTMTSTTITITSMKKKTRECEEKYYNGAKWKGRARALSMKKVKEKWIC